MRNSAVSMPPRESADRVDERDGAVRVHTAVEHDDRLASRACALDRRCHRRRAVGRDEEDVAVAVGDEVVDIGDLRVIGVLRVARLHLADRTRLLQHLELLVHGDPARLSPGVGDRRVREARLLGARTGERRRVDHLGVDVLQVRLVLRTLGHDVALGVLLVELGLVEPLVRRSRFTRVSGGGRRHRRVGRAPGEREQRGYRHRRGGDHHRSSHG
jgi:hypothetical protein